MFRLLGGAVDVRRVRARGREQRSGCAEGLRVPCSVQHPAFSSEHAPHGDQQHSAGLQDATSKPFHYVCI